MKNSVAIDETQTGELLLIDMDTENKYLFTQFDLDNSVVNRCSWSQISDTTVIVDMSRDPGPLMIPAFSRQNGVFDSVLIRDPENSTAYFISGSELAKRKINGISHPGANCVLRISSGSSNFETLHPLQRALLQSSTY